MGGVSVSEGLSMTAVSLAFGLGGMGLIKLGQKLGKWTVRTYPDSRAGRFFQRFRCFNAMPYHELEQSLLHLWQNYTMEVSINQEESQTVEKDVHPAAPPKKSKKIKTLDIVDSPQVEEGLAWPSNTTPTSREARLVLEGLTPFNIHPPQASSTPSKRLTAQQLSPLVEETISPQGSTPKQTLFAEAETVGETPLTSRRPVQPVSDLTQDATCVRMVDEIMRRTNAREKDRQVHSVRKLLELITQRQMYPQTVPQPPKCHPEPMTPTVPKQEDFYDEEIDGNKFEDVKFVDDQQDAAEIEV